MDNRLFSNSPSQVSSDRILYTPSAFAKSTLLHLQEAGSLKALVPHASRRSDLVSYLFILVKAGSGDLSYDGVHYGLYSGDCVFIDCRKPYSHSTSSTDLWELSWCHFYGPNLSSIYTKYVERGGVPVFHPGDSFTYESLLSELFTIASSSDYIRDMRINETLASLLTLLMEESWHPETSRTGKKRLELQSVKDYIDVHYKERIILDDLAEMFFINKYYLSKIFKEQFGIPVNAYVLQIRITQAKQLLRFTDQTVERIGIEVGLKDANYFTRMFKKIEGMTPGEYRKKWVSSK